jgi:hypothetical protein
MYTLSGAQYFGSLGNIAWLNPKDGSVTPFSGGDGIHGYDVQPGLPQLAYYICNGTYSVVSLYEKGGLGSNELDACFACCCKEGTFVGGHEVKLSAALSRWETGVGNQIDTSRLECIENLCTRSGTVWNLCIVILNTPYVCHRVHLLSKYIRIRGLAPMNIVNSTEARLYVCLIILLL